MKRHFGYSYACFFQKTLVCILFLAAGFFSNARAQAPANDDCSAAIPVICGDVIVGSNESAASDETVAGDCGTTVNSPGVWYLFDGTGDEITLSLCSNTAFDSKISVYTGSCAGLTCLAGNDDFCGVQSEVTFVSTSGTTYYILVHSYNGATGSFDLTVTCEAPNPVPANDDCDNAVEVFCGEVVAGTTLGATTDGVPTCGVTSTAPGVWYKFTGTGDNITVSTCNNASYDTKISVFMDGCATLTCVDGNDDGTGCGTTSELSFPSSLGTQYLILVHGYSTNSGDFTLTVTCTVGGSNDDCAGALPISCGETLNGSTTSATADGAPTCGPATVTSPGVWYKFTGTGEQIQLSTCNNADFDTKISVFADGCGLLTCIAGNDDDANCSGFTSTATFVSTPGTEYLILVHGYQAETGSFSLSASCSPAIPPPPNDNCADITATAITNGVPQTFSGTTLGATQDADEAAEFGYAVVWEAFTVSGDCNNVELAYCGSVSPTFNIFARLYLGCLPGNSFVEDDDGVPDETTCGDGNVIYTFTNLPAGTYYVPVFADAAFLTPLDSYTLTVTSVDCPPPSPNDSCHQAVAVFCGDVVTGNTAGTTVDNVNDCSGVAVTAPGIWYSFTGTGDFVTFSTCGTANYDTKLTVYTDGCGVLSCVAQNDDGGGCAGFTSSVGFLSQPGVEYLILVHGYDAAASGIFDMSVTCTQDLLPNEFCSDVLPTTIANGSSATFTGSTDGAVNDPADDAEFGYKVVWEAFTVTGECNNITVAYCGSASPTFNIFARLYLGCPPGNTYISDDDGVPDETTCGDGNLIYTFSFVAAGTYYIPVFADAAFLDPLGDYTITVSSADCPPPAPNDSCHQALPLVCGDIVTGNTFGATADNAPECVVTNTSPGIWYSFTGTGDYITLSTCGTASFDTKISVYTGGCGALTCVTGNDDGPGCSGFTSTAGFISEPGVEYLILVHGYQSLAGSFDLAVTCEPVVVPNDACTGAVAVTCGSVVQGSTTGAFPDGMAFCGTSNTAPGVWYVFAGTGDFVTVSTCGSADFDSKLSVFSGDCGALTCVGGNDDFTGCAGLTSQFGFQTEVGTNYYILVHAFSSASGLFDLYVTCQVPLPNDDCSDVTPTAVTSGTPASFTGTTDGAVQSSFEAAEFGYSVVWEAFSLSGSCDHNVVISYCGSLSPTFNIYARLYTDCSAGSFIEDSDGLPDDVACGDGNITYNFDHVPSGNYYIPVFADPAFLDPLGDYTVTVLSNDEVITGFTVVNSDTDTDIGPLNEGDIINLHNSPPLTIRANTCGTPGSVKLELNGALPRIENIAPYSLTGDNPTGNYRPWNAAVGSYSLTASAYAGANASGGLTGLPATVNFTVIDEDCSFLEVLVTTDNYGEETSWQLLDVTDNVILGSAAEGSLASNTSFRNLFCIPNGHCIEFTIYDAFGDGMCCTWGTGSYSLVLAGQTLVTGGSFGDSETFNIGDCNFDCLGILNGTAVTDVNGNCCQPEDLDCAGVCFGGNTGSQVVSFTLIDAANDVDLGLLTDGAVIDLSVTGPINVRADVCENNTESVQFNVNGSFYSMENLPFYAIAGGNGSDYNSWNVLPGVYTIRATPYSGNNGTGAAGAYGEITITIIDGTQPCGSADRRVTSFTLINAATDADLGTLLDGAVIDLSVTGSISIRANVCDEANIESVRFQVNGSSYRMENLPFYTIAGDNNGNYSAWNVTPGVYTIRATPYSADNGTGTAGTYHEVTITVISGGGLKMDGQEQLSANALTGEMIHAFPNPFKDNLTFEFSVPAESRVSLELFSISGAKIATVFEGNLEAGEIRQAVFSAGELASGLYMYRMKTNDSVFTEKVTLTR